MKGGDLMQVICSQCGEVGLLQKITPRYYRVRHSISSQLRSDYGKLFNHRTFSYHRVSTEWALQQISDEEAQIKKLYSIE
jgi:hypothetical protein